MELLQHSHGEVSELGELDNISLGDDSTRKRCKIGDPLALPGFIGGYAKERSLTFDCQRAINLYPVKGTPLSASDKMLYSTPGQKFVLNIGSSAIRGELKVGTRLYVVAGNQVYQVDSGFGSVLASGVLNTSAGLVQMSWNNAHQIGIIDGENLYILDISNLLAPALSTITINLDGRPSSICFLNQRFIISILGTQEFQWSDINDGSTWGALNKDFATQYPDLLVACVAINGQLLLMKQSNVEIWLNNPTLEGVVDFVFNYSGQIIQYGLNNAHSYGIIGNNVVWITSSYNESVKMVYSTGSGANTISNSDIEQEISQFGDISTAYTLVSNQRGNDTAIFTFPNGLTTYCFDFSQQEWHERSDFLLGYWSPLCISSFGTNVEIIGDANGNLYQLDFNTFTDGFPTHPIIKTRITPHYNKSGKTMFVHSLQVLFEQGLGNKTSSGVIDPMSVPTTIYLASSTNILYAMTVDTNGILSDPEVSNSGQPGSIIIMYSAGDNTYWQLIVSDPVIPGNPGILTVTQVTGPQNSNPLIKDAFGGIWMVYAITGGFLQVVNLANSTPPQVCLEISRDGGKSFGNKYFVSMGFEGDYIARSIWNCLGRAKDLVFKISISDPMPVALIQGLADIEVGLS